MNDIRELIRKLVELNSAQGIEKVIVKQAGEYGNISIDSIHVEDDFAVIETEVLSKKEDEEEAVEAEQEVSLSVGPENAHTLVYNTNPHSLIADEDTEEDAEEEIEEETEEDPEPSEETSVKKHKKEEAVEEA